MAQVSLHDVPSLESIDHNSFLQSIAGTRQTPARLLKELFQRMWPVHTGWNLIRIGNQSDGGYLIPDCIGGLDACFSPGVDNQYSLELQLANTYGMQVYLCDPGEPRGMPSNPHLTYERMALAGKSGNNAISLADWVCSHGYSTNSNLLLTMDIEGYEYPVIAGLPTQHLLAFRAITLEIHYLWTLHSLDCFIEFNQIFSAIFKYFDIVHLHPNSLSGFRVNEFDHTCYSCIELTLLNKGMRLAMPSPVQRLPHILDRDNGPSSPPIDYSSFTSI